MTAPDEDTSFLQPAARAANEHTAKAIKRALFIINFENSSLKLIALDMRGMSSK